MASLPGGMDLIMKHFVDQYRGGMLPTLKDKLPGILMADMLLMKKWRYWKTGPTYRDPENAITLIGALDDCLVDNGFYIPLDWKTKGSKPKDDGSQYYQTQLDCYNLMLEANNFPVRDEGWLVYIYPDGAEVRRDCGTPVINVLFAMEPFKLVCSRDRAKEILLKAAECLRGPRPKSAHTCEHCQYLERVGLLNSVEVAA